MSEGTKGEGDSIAKIARDLRALVEWEEVIGGGGFPSVQLPSDASPSVHVSQQRPEPGPDRQRSVSPSRAPSGPEATRQVRPNENASQPDPRSAQHAAPTPAVAAVADSADEAAEATQAGPGLAAAGDARQRLHVLAQAAASCTRCELHKERTKSVFARGSATARLVFVGEGPGYNEDQQGEPFVGKAGKLLDRMVGAMGLRQDQIYICNVVKCRPPNNRTPKPEEAAQCSSYLRQQLDIVQPDVMVALGRTAAEALNLAEPGQRGWRGQWGKWNKIPVMATYHPAFLLRSPQFKRPVWQDLQKVMARLGLPPPKGS